MFRETCKNHVKSVKVQIHPGGPPRQGRQRRVIRITLNLFSGQKNNLFERKALIVIQIGRDNSLFSSSSFFFVYKMW